MPTLISMLIYSCVKQKAICQSAKTTNLFELSHEMRQHAPRLQHVVAPEEKDALRLAGEAVASAAVCLLSGHHDCPSYIAVDVDKLESCLAVLRLNIHKLNDSKPITHA